MDSSSPRGSGPTEKTEDKIKIDQEINCRPLNEIKINEIKAIVRSIFESSNDSTE